MYNEEYLFKEVYKVNGKGFHVCGALVQESEDRYRLHGWMTVNNRDRKYFRSSNETPNTLRRRFDVLSRTLAEFFGIPVTHQVLEATPVVFDQTLLMEVARNTNFN